MSVPHNQVVEIPDLHMGKPGEKFVGQIVSSSGGMIVIAHDWTALNLSAGDRERSFILTWADESGKKFHPVRIVKDAPGRLECRFVYDEKRESLRIKCDVDVWFTLIEETALADTANTILSRVSSAVESESEVDRLMRSDQEEDALHGEIVAIRKLLERLSDQMDRLIAATEGNAPAPEPAERQAADVLDISATGLQFRHESSLKSGDYVKLKLKFRGTPGPPIEAVGVVARCRVRANESFHPEHYNFGIQFTHIRENDREIVVRHIFKVQRNILRERKAETA